MPPAHQSLLPALAVITVLHCSHGCPSGCLCALLVPPRLLAGDASPALPEWGERRTPGFGGGMAARSGESIPDAQR